MSSTISEPIPILMPQAGNSMEEGTILAWKVKVGESIKVGDVLYELETDKATIEVEAEVAGILGSIVVQNGQTAPVKSIVAYLGDGAPAAPSAPVPRLGSSAPARATSDVFSPTRQRVSPVARRAAAELGVDVAAIQIGSGPDGRVVRADVERASRSIPTPSPAPISAFTAVAGNRRPMSKMRRAIGRNLSASKQTVPHWYAKLTIDAEPALALHRREKALYPCSLNDVIVCAVSRALIELPLFRSRIEGDEIVEIEGAHVGLAVGMEEGLVVPVLKNADALSLKGIAHESRRLIEAAKSGKVEGMGEGVFTISNLGMFGVEEFVAIVNPPESGILAVGAARENVTVRDGALRIGRTMTLTLSADHRLIDGTMGAKFLARLKQLLENPAEIGGA